ncbi:MAG TPA: DUF1080 domain-containing protein [Prolixibacteraceae bacterium]|jgi:hypothetical protein
MKIFIAILLICTTVSVFAKKKEKNTLSKDEIKSGWELIFDGTTTKGWRGYGQKTMPEKGWDVVDGKLHCMANGGGGDIIFNKKLTNFKLELSWKISEGGNSGIFIYGKEVAGTPIYHSAPEYQLLDDQNHADAKDGKDGNHKSGSLYDILPAVPQNANPALKWNQAKIVSKDGKVEFWQNDVKVLEFQIGNANWKKLCAGSKFKDWPDFVNNPAKDGYIGLQDHGNEIWFKNIKLKVLK